MQKSFQVLDHGYLNYIEHWGSDERIIEAARMSTAKGFRSWESYFECRECGKWWMETEQPGCEHSMQDWVKNPRGDLGLLSHLFLSKPQHSTPFEMAGVVIEVMAPIMVFREWHRHRTQSYNEMSARYTPLPNANYIPSVERLTVGSDGKNKQAGTVRGAGVLTEADAESFRKGLRLIYHNQEQLYQTALALGVPKELARVHLPVGRYSRMRASANLLNWLKFLTLRNHPKAQWEIRQYASVLGTLVKELFPKTWSLFEESRSGQS